MVPNHYFCRLADHNIKNATEVDLLFSTFFVEIASFAVFRSPRQSFPRKPFYLTIPSHHHQSSTDNSIRDFLRLNTFYGMQKTLNYRVAYYAESLVSNTRIRSKMICMTIETLEERTYMFPKRLYNLC